MAVPVVPLDFRTVPLSEYLIFAVVLSDGLLSPKIGVAIGVQIVDIRELGVPEIVTVLVDMLHGIADVDVRLSYTDDIHQLTQHGKDDGRRCFGDGIVHDACARTEIGGLNWPLQLLVAFVLMKTFSPGAYPTAPFPRVEL